MIPAKAAKRCDRKHWHIVQDKGVDEELHKGVFFGCIRNIPRPKCVL